MMAKGLRGRGEEEFVNSSLFIISVIIFSHRGLKYSYRTLCLTFHLSNTLKLGSSLRAFAPSLG